MGLTRAAYKINAAETFSTCTPDFYSSAIWLELSLSDQSAAETEPGQFILAFSDNQPDLARADANRFGFTGGTDPQYRDRAPTRNCCEDAPLRRQVRYARGGNSQLDSQEEQRKQSAHIFGGSR